eukprot:SAG31_NODE_431_length_15775_cov_3.350663_8_plen_73_part_00
MKQAIERVATSPSGVPIYEYAYGWEPVGSTSPKHIGTMAQDLLLMGYGRDVVTIDDFGFFEVDYSIIDVDEY